MDTSLLGYKDLIRRTIAPLDTPVTDVPHCGHITVFAELLSYFDIFFRVIAVQFNHPHTDSHRPVHRFQNFILSTLYIQHKYINMSYSMFGKEGFECLAWYAHWFFLGVNPICCVALCHCIHHTPHCSVSNKINTTTRIAVCTLNASGHFFFKCVDIFRVSFSQQRFLLQSLFKVPTIAISNTI